MPNKSAGLVSSHDCESAPLVTIGHAVSRLLCRAVALIAFICACGTPTLSFAQVAIPNISPGTNPNGENGTSPATDAVTNFLTQGPDVWTSPDGLTSSLQIMLLLTVLSLAPAILLMTTSFVRIVIVLGLLRQAMGTQQAPPSQVITALALFMTLLIMTPVWTQVYNDAIAPYTDPTVAMSLEEAWGKGIRPIRQFMAKQIENAKNTQDVFMFYQYLPQTYDPPQSYDDVPLQVLLPAYMLSELKTAFLIGFNIYLPFLILDIVISSVTISMGMLMLPPVMISLPFKLLLFVLVDGWNLVVEMLMNSFMPFT